MLSLSKQTDYALLALTALAHRENEAYAAGGALPVSVPAKEIAEQYGIPMEFLAKVLQKLARAHIVTSTFGPTGGYKLALSANQIPVGQIIAIIDGGVALTQCMRIEGDNDCVHTSSCTIRGPLTRINDEIVRVLNTLTLDQIAEPEPAQLVQIEMARRPRAYPAASAASPPDSGGESRFSVKIAR